MLSTINYIIYKYIYLFIYNIIYTCNFSFLNRSYESSILVIVIIVIVTICNALQLRAVIISGSAMTSLIGKFKRLSKHSVCHARYVI